MFNVLKFIILAALAFAGLALFLSYGAPTSSGGFGLASVGSSWSSSATDDDTDDRIRDISDQVEDLTRSPHSEYVRLYIGNTDTRDEDEEYVVLSLDDDAPSALNISHWKIQRVGGAAYTLGGVDDIPLYGAKHENSPALIRPGDTVYIVSGRTTIGTSFQTNLCTGYLDENRSITPRITRACPVPYTDGDLRYLGIDVDDVERDWERGRESEDRTCFEILDRMGSCQDPERPDRETISNKCYDFVQDIGYDSCVDTHRNDRDFLQDEWYIYLKRFDDLWDDDDTILLFDETGHTVATLRS